MLQKIIWIGPVKFSDSSQSTLGASKLARRLFDLTERDCDVTVVGTTACKAMMQESSTLSAYNVFENASVVWDFLKGKQLPGVLALDRVSFLVFLLFFSEKNKIMSLNCYSKRQNIM